MASLLKFAISAFFIVVLLILITLSLLSVRRGVLPHVLPSLVQPEPALVTDVVSNVSRALSEVEVRAKRLQIALRHLGTAARQLVAQEERRMKHDKRGQFEHREFCDNAWWWWKKIIIASNISKRKQAIQTEQQNSTISTSFTDTSSTEAAT